MELKEQTTEQAEPHTCRSCNTDTWVQARISIWRCRYCDETWKTNADGGERPHR